MNTHEFTPAAHDLEYKYPCIDALCRVDGVLCNGGKPP
jgi:hypothetical protein